MEDLYELIIHPESREFGINMLCSILGCKRVAFDNGKFFEENLYHSLARKSNHVISYVCLFTRSDDKKFEKKFLSDLQEQFKKSHNLCSIHFNENLIHFSIFLNIK